MVIAKRPTVWTQFWLDVYESHDVQDIHVLIQKVRDRDANAPQEPEEDPVGPAEEENHATEPVKMPVKAETKIKTDPAAEEAVAVTPPIVYLTEAVNSMWPAGVTMSEVSSLF